MDGGGAMSRALLLCAAATLLAASVHGQEPTPRTAVAELGPVVSLAVLPHSGEPWLVASDTTGRVVVREAGGAVVAGWAEATQGPVVAAVAGEPPVVYFASASSGMQQWNPATKQRTALALALPAAVEGLSAGCGGKCLAVRVAGRLVGRIDVGASQPTVTWLGRSSTDAAICATGTGWVVAAGGGETNAFAPTGQRFTLRASAVWHASYGDGGGVRCGQSQAWAWVDGGIGAWTLPASAPPGAPKPQPVGQWALQTLQGCAVDPAGNQLWCHRAADPAGQRLTVAAVGPADRALGPVLAYPTVVLPGGGLVVALGPQLLRAENGHLQAVGAPPHTPLVVTRDAVHHQLAVCWRDHVAVWANDGGRLLRPKLALPAGTADQPAKCARLGFTPDGGVRLLLADLRAFVAGPSAPAFVPETAPAPAKPKDVAWPDNSTVVASDAERHWLWSAATGWLQGPPLASQAVWRMPNQLVEPGGSVAGGDSDDDDEGMRYYRRQRRMRQRNVETGHWIAPDGRHLFASPECTVHAVFDKTGDRLAAVRPDGQLCSYAAPSGLPSACTRTASLNDTVQWSEDRTTLLVLTGQRYVLRDAKTLAQLASGLLPIGTNQLLGFASHFLLVRWSTDGDDKPVYLGLDLVSLARLPTDKLPAPLLQILAAATKAKKPHHGGRDDDDDEEQEQTASQLRNKEKYELRRDEDTALMVVRRKADGKKMLTFVGDADVTFDPRQRLLLTSGEKPGLYDIEAGRQLVDFAAATCRVGGAELADNGRWMVLQGEQRAVATRWPGAGPFVELLPAGEAGRLTLAAHSSFAVAFLASGSQWLDLANPTDHLPVAAIAASARLAPDGKVLADLVLDGDRVLQVVRRDGSHSELPDPIVAAQKTLAGSDEHGTRWAVMRRSGSVAMPLAVVDVLAGRWQTLHGATPNWGTAHACNWWPSDDRVVCATASSIGVWSTKDGQPQWSCPTAYAKVLDGPDPQQPLLACLWPFGLEVYDTAANAGSKWLRPAP